MSYAPLSVMGRASGMPRWNRRPNQRWAVETPTPLRAAFGLRTWVLAVLALAVALHPNSVHACAACYGQSDSPMAAGMNWGIFSLLAVVMVVLAGVASFFTYLARQSAKTALLATSAVAGRHDRNAPLLGRGDRRKHLGLGTLQPVGGIGHRCAQTSFGAGVRQITP